MAAHNALGKQGEDLAERYLTEAGFTVLHRNWRYSHYEIDLIALKGQMLHFVEVKMRSSKKFGLPEEAVTKTKFQRLLNAADEFLFLHRQYKHVQYDVLAISKSSNNVIDYFFIEDVYL